MIPMANVFCKLAGPISAVGRVSCIWFDSSQVLFQSPAYYFTGCHLPVTKQKHWALENLVSMKSKVIITGNSD